MGWWHNKLCAPQKMELSMPLEPGLQCKKINGRRMDHNAELDLKPVKAINGIGIENHIGRGRTFLPSLRSYPPPKQECLIEPHWWQETGISQESGQFILSDKGHVPFNVSLVFDQFLGQNSVRRV